MNERPMPEPIEQRIIDRMIRRIGSVWLHASGDLYTVRQITNRANDCAGYPCTVVYERTLSGEPYSMPATDWHHSMTLFIPG